LKNIFIAFPHRKSYIEFLEWFVYVYEMLLLQNMPLIMAYSPFFITIQGPTNVVIPGFHTVITVKPH
jgi:hypothetical protein